MIYKVTFGFGGASQGWAETHAMQQQSQDPASLATMLRNLMQKRANFLGLPFAVTHCRCAKFYDEVLAQRSRGSHLIKEPITTANPTLTGAAEPADVAIIVRWTPNVSNPVIAATFSGAEADTFLGGPPDEAVTNAGQVLLGSAGLGAAMGTYRSEMIAANMGWLSVKREDDVKIKAITQNIDGTIEFELDRATVAPVVLNKVAMVRVRGVNQGRTPIPGQVNVIFTSLTHCHTVDVIAFVLPQVGGFMRVYNPVPTFLAYAGMSIELQTGQHDRGRPFGTPRGRQAKQVRG